MAAPVFDLLRSRTFDSLVWLKLDQEPRYGVFAKWLAHMVQQPGFQILTTRCDTVQRVAMNVVHQHNGSLPMNQVLEHVAEALRMQLELSEPGQKRLEEEFQHLHDATPAGATLYGAHPAASEKMILMLIRAARVDAYSSFRPRIAALISALENIVAAHHLASPESRNTVSIEKNLGQLGSNLIDAQKLSSATSHVSSSLPIQDSRRVRIENALSDLRDLLDAGLGQAEKIHVLTSQVKDQATDSAVISIHPEPVRQAKHVFDEAVAYTVRCLKAIRCAELEMSDGYKSEHDARLASMTWSSCRAGERFLIPAVLVVASEAELRREQLGMFLECVAAGLPLRWLVRQSMDDKSVVEGQDLGILAASHRTPYVCRTSLGRPEMIAQTTTQVALNLEPVIWIVAHAEHEHSDIAFSMTEAAIWGRLTPLYTYDPSCGSDWASRLDISRNPVPELEWPLIPNPAGESAPLTAADVLQSFRSGSQMLDPDWNEDLLVPVVHFEEKARQIPYTWMVGPDRQRLRSVVTSDVIQIGTDRLHHWHQLQELTGYRNRHAQAAAERARTEARIEFAAQALELQAQIDAAEEIGARKAMTRLARVLLDVDLNEPVMFEKAKPLVTLQEPQQNVMDATAEQEEKAPLPAELELDDDAFIDTPLCTSCHECIGVNALMFQYDDNKQAYLADAAAGTYADLVKAAENVLPNAFTRAHLGRETKPQQKLWWRAAPFR